MLRKFTLLGLFVSAMATAQVSSYNFLSIVLPYQPIATSPGGTITDHTVEDDVITPNRATLPFSFKLGANTHTSVGIGENGFIWFGDASSDDAVVFFNPLSNAQDVSVEGIVSALGFDLHPQTDGSTTVKSGYFGTSPNRVFVIEWAHTSEINAIFDPAGPDDLNFQIRLHETSNSVEIAYGTFTLNPNITHAAEVGIKTSDTDFAMRTTAADWADTQAATALNDACVLSQIIKPVLGTRMVWQPTSLGTKSFDKKVLGLYPVPAADVLRVANQQYTGSDYAIYDLSGRSVQTGTLDADAIAVGALASGQYLLKLVGQGVTVSAKFLKL